MLFPLLTAALLWGVVASSPMTCKNEQKSKVWEVRASEVTVTDCTFTKGVDLVVGPMTRDAVGRSRTDVVVSMSDSDIYDLSIDALNGGNVKMNIPFLLSVSNNNISKSIRIYGIFPHGSSLVFSGNTMGTTDSTLIRSSYGGTKSLVLSGSSTISFKDNTMTLEQESGSVPFLWDCDTLSLTDNSTLACTGNNVTVKAKTNFYDLAFLKASTANVLNSFIVVSDNIMTWSNQGTKKSDVVIISFVKEAGDCSDSNITITDNRINTIENTAFKHLWDVDKDKKINNITLDACGNSLNGATLYNLGQNYLNPEGLAKFLVSECPNPNPNPNPNPGTNVTTGIATTSTVIACFVLYLFIYVLF